MRGLKNFKLLKKLSLFCMVALTFSVTNWAFTESLAQNWWDEEYEPNKVENPVQAAEEKLSKLPNAPWYDPESGKIRPIDGIQPKDPEPERRPKHSQPPAATTNNTGANFPNWDLSFIGTWFTYLLYALLAIGLLVLIYFIAKTFYENSDAGVVKQKNLEDDISTQVDRVENLPFQIKRPDADLLAEARRHYNEGNFREAIIYLFSYQLVELDKGQAIRLAKGKTNGQYLRELNRKIDLQDILELTMNAFEDVFFWSARVITGSI